MTTPTIFGVKREDLLQAVHNAFTRRHPPEDCSAAADAALNYIATHQVTRACTCCGAKYDQCPSCAADDAYEKGRKDATCDREHDDEWVEVPTWRDFPDGVRFRSEWAQGATSGGRFFVRRDDLEPEPVDKRVEATAQWLAEYIGNGEDGTANEWLNEAESLLEALDKIEGER